LRESVAKILNLFKKKCLVKLRAIEDPHSSAEYNWMHRQKYFIDKSGIKKRDTDLRTARYDQPMMT